MMPDDYFQSFRPGCQEHFDRMARKFSARAESYRSLSVRLLVGCALMIVTGVAVFLYPMRFAEIPEAKQDNLATIQKKIDEITQELGKPAKLLQIARERYAALSPVFEVYASLNGIRDSYNLAKLDDLRRLFNRLNDGSQEPLELDTSTYLMVGNRGKTTISAETLKWLHDQIEAKSNLSSDMAAIQDLSEHNGGTKQKDAVNAAIDGFRRNFSWVEPLHQEIKNELAKADEEKSRSESQSDQQMRRQQELSLQATKIIADEAVRMKTWVFLQVFIPIFVIRLAVVILVLYLTRIILATYRFTIGISVYYQSLGDAMQLVSLDNGNYRLEDLEKLTKLLSTENLRMEAITGAEDYLLRLLGDYSKAKPDNIK